MAKRLEREATSDEARIARAYRLLYGRTPTKSDIQLGLEFLRGSHDAWPRYSQAFLSSSEFITVN